MDNNEFIAIQEMLAMSTPEFGQALGKSRSVINRYRNGDYGIPETVGKAAWLLYGVNFGLARIVIAIMHICHGGKMVGTGVLAEKLHWIGYRFPSSTTVGGVLAQLEKKGEVIHIRHGVYAIKKNANHRNRRGKRE